jgi:phosphoribosylaminoimidazole-succinocarboxamide synthase
MSLRDALISHLESDFITIDPDRLASLGEHRRGKVRDLFVGEDEILMVTSDRLSAFDVVLTTIPCKGAILNAIAVSAFEQTQDIWPNHLIDAPHPNVLRVRRADPLPIEVIVRRYITGSLWRDYEAGRHGVYEVPIPEGMRRDQRFETPIITPSTKAEVGIHDEPISQRKIVEDQMVSQALMDEAARAALLLFARGEELAAERGLILVDTKYEFGMIDGQLVVIDEIHTADSSRYWLADEYEARFQAGEQQRMLDKENIRQWLIGEGYQGEGPPPPIPDDIRLDLAEKYATLHARLLGWEFVPGEADVQGSIYRTLGV